MTRSHGSLHTMGIESADLRDTALAQIGGAWEGRGAEVDVM